MGTTIEIEHLFFNTPARKKFLKTDAVELHHIVDVVQRYALINPSISFRLLHNGNELLNSPSVGDLRSNIASIYGIQVAKELLEVNYEREGIRIGGYIGKPSQSRHDKNQQALFVNGRWIKNEDISTAVYDAYHSLLFVNTHPILVLNVQLDPQRIDVNVHPTKSEIKIEQKEAVCNAVFTAVKETLQRHNLTPSVEVEQQLTFGTPVRKPTRAETKYAFEPSAQTVFTVQESSAGEDYTAHDAESIVSEQTIPENIPANLKFPSMKILGQVHKTFFVAETAGGVFFIDQHAAHERVLYEQFRHQYMNQEVQIQRLLQGEVLECTPTERILLQEHKAELENLGFSLEEFGGNTIVVKSVPLILGRQQPTEIIYEIIAMLQEGKQKLSDKKEEIITRMACRAAVMAGEVLTIQTMEKILHELSLTQFPYTCPHGRPTMIKTEAEELEKKFKRK